MFWLVTFYLPFSFQRLFCFSVIGFDVILRIVSLEIRVAHRETIQVHVSYLHKEWLLAQ